MGGAISSTVAFSSSSQNGLQVGSWKILIRKLHPVPPVLWASQRCLASSFKASDLQVELCHTLKKKPNRKDHLIFGKHFTDHMLTVEWCSEEGWNVPCIHPFRHLRLHPACSALHYALQLFEGMKAFRGKDQRVRLFRPWLNMDRMLRSSLRLCLPSFNKLELLECIRRLIEIDEEWVPSGDERKASLYIRPTLIGNESCLGVHPSTRALLYVILSPVGSYFSGDSLTPISLLADPRFVRSWVGGVGDCKLGGNYGPTVFVQRIANQQNCEQVLWLYGPDHYLTEIGTMNIFIFWTHKDGVLELVTPPLDGTILPGVVRRSLLDLAQMWGEFRVSERHVCMSELLLALREGRVQEIFGSGTACQVCPVHRILYQGEHLHIPTMENGPKLTLRFQKTLCEIQYGDGYQEWMLPV
ncbi:branched-chain-amino-acid aminotransferase, mitochondrial isoform X3 [Trichosurus vulpecula]|uniref:branched-chain-amino-acid aminotransferase, mitochondrial isoform X3 n=1 Tax=Trichosurus vulpecula TaxID=9337 RepID=UPI00186AF254|nr:branched-chain-amino-acid aminotransferase, mitochondrial isoform X3 [Trichosurus vulpecula]